MALTEEDKLEEWAVNLINDYEASGNYSSSEPKRIGRFSGELVANQEAYYELLDMARSQNLTGKELVQTVRSIEDLLLGAKQSIKNPKIKVMVDSMSFNPSDRRQLISDVIHHLYAQRTGGDTLRKLSQQERKSGRNILRSEGYEWGNIPKNLRSLFRSWHLYSDRLQGAERIGADRVRQGIEVKDLQNPVMHPSGMDVNPTRTIRGATTAEEAVYGVGGSPGMLAQMEAQKEATLAVEADPNLQRTQQAVDELFGSQYDPEASGETLAERRQLGIDKADELADIFETAARNSPGVRILNGVARWIPGDKEDYLLGAGLAVAGAGSTLLAGGSPAQAAETGRRVAVDVATQDFQDINTALTTERKKDLPTLQRDFQGLAGVSNVATFIPGIRIGSAVASLVFTGAGVAVGNRIKRDERKERRQQFLANPRYVNPDDDHVLTQTDKSFKTGRY